MKKEQILNNYIESSRKIKFKWGEVDCCLWAADFVKKITNIDYAEEFRGRYKTEKGALSIIKKSGFDNLEMLINSKLNQVAISQAKRGDVMLSKDGALGICCGRNIFFLCKEGLTEYSIRDCIRAWSID